MKKIFITGSTDGIGKLTALQLAKAGHAIIIHGRNTSKLEKVIAEIKLESNNPNVNGYVSDFSDFESIKSMSSIIKKEVQSIDVLINNAGVFKSSVEKNKDGFDLRFAVNYLAPYLLTNEIISLIEKGEAPRIINLSSAAQSSVNINALKGSQSLSMQEAYAQSKLALTMWSFDVAQKLPNINVIAVNPGSLLNTRMANEAYGQHWSPAEKGANILSDLATAEQYAESSGKYFDNDRGIFNHAHPDAYDANKILQLITETKSILDI